MKILTFSFMKIQATSQVIYKFCFFFKKIKIKNENFRFFLNLIFKRINIIIKAKNREKSDLKDEEQESTTKKKQKKENTG